MPKFSERLAHAWNAFVNNHDNSPVPYNATVYTNSYRPDRVRLTRGNERTIITAIYNRIALDCSAISIKHVRLDANDRYLETIESGLNNVLNLDANQDQTGRAFIHDAVLSMLDEGSVVLVPTDTDISIWNANTFDILKMRTGKVTQWYPEHVKVMVFNERLGKKEEVILPKKSVAIIENPFYAVMNERNSTFQRLIRKLAILDAIDDQSSSGKLDLIIQLPYVVKSDSRRDQANRRRKELEEQLAGSKYGIAYTDGTEKITQLNRSVTNNLMEQIEYLTKTLYGQLGISENILNGTANETEMLNYNNRVIEPILSSIIDELKRKFLTKTARTQKQSIMFFRDPFKLVPINNIADIADRFTRNEILSSNEFRGIIGFKPSDDPNADVLRNKNLNPTDSEEAAMMEQQMGMNPEMQPEMQPEEPQYSEEEVSDENINNVYSQLTQMGYDPQELQNMTVSEMLDIWRQNQKGG